MKNILLRSATGLVYVGLILAGILINEVSYLCLLILICIPALLEFYRLAPKGSTPNSLGVRVLDVAGGISLICGVWFFLNQWSVYAFGVFLLYFLARFISTLYSSEKEPLRELLRSMTGIMYIALPLALSNIAYMESKYIVLAMFIFIWVNDTGAFLIGSAIGRHRLFERISPKKSWEGFWGGLVFCIAAAIVMYNFWPASFSQFKIGSMIAFGVIVSVFATCGDLVESLIKRTIHIKDSGNILPGHGGMLDRIDSLLIVIPAVICMMIFIL
ncbi:MAG: phosphatidate cytidylyltransferase [Muribaculum sp.]|nr:phosphatidate cytidylyltransferase [Muribaculum sp.]